MQPTTLLIQVSDDSPVLPRLNAFSDTAQTGRGMRLLQALSTEHGVLQGADGAARKTVWVRLADGPAADLGALGDAALAARYAGLDWLAAATAPDSSLGGRVRADA